MKLIVAIIVMAVMSFTGLEAKTSKSKKSKARTTQTQPTQPAFKKIIMYTESMSQNFITYRLWLTLDAHGKAIWQTQQKGDTKSYTKYGTWTLNSTYDSNGNKMEYYKIFINEINATLYIAKGSTRLYGNYNDLIKKNGDYVTIRYLDY